MKNAEGISWECVESTIRHNSQLYLEGKVIDVTLNYLATLKRKKMNYMLFHSSICKYIAVSLMVVFVLLFSAGDGLAASTTKKSVLVLNSYHLGYKWSDDIIEGIQAVFAPSAQNIELHLEYMDTQRIADPEYMQKLYEVYKYKFASQKFDVIIVSDDPAFNFVRKYHNELFPETPIVFCGVNYFEDSMLTGEQLFTGVVENQDIKTTIEVALRLHPDTKNIYYVNDRTVTGRAIEKVLYETMPLFEDRIKFISLVDNTMAQNQLAVSQLPLDSLVLFLIFFQDASGQRFSYDEGISQISTKSSVPVYGVWDMYLGHGIAGGMLTSGYYQGEAAANIAQRVINGETVSNIPVVKNSPNYFMFDNLQLRRFGISKADLPSDSYVINDFYSGKKQVLVLNSYHYEMSWMDGIISGIESVIDPMSDMDICYEFMDIKHNPGPEYIQKLYEIYKYKFNNKHFDAIIVSDDDAYKLLLKYQPELFQDVPVVFCGVNYFQENDLKEKGLFTGVVEAIDVKKTLEIALKLHPAVKRIVVINDNSTTGIANKKLLEQAATDFPTVQFIFFEDMNMTEIQNKVAALTDDSLILLMTFNKDKSNNVFSYEESIRLISEKATVPIYGLWDFYLGHGIVGGMITSAYNQGAMAAQMLLRILSGVNPADIMVQKESPNQYMFDYNYLQRFNISTDQLPAGSIVVNQPIAFYQRYQSAFLGILIFGMLALLIIQHYKAQLRLKIFATTDALTGILNRRTGLALIKEQMDIAKRYNTKLTIGFIDLNDLKVVNDTGGHAEGDKLIHVLGQLLTKQLKASDVLCRFGGDEFVVAFTKCDMENAMLIWEKFEKELTLFNENSGSVYVLSVSSGFAEYDPKRTVSMDELINMADDAMYAAKRKYKLERGSVNK